jgi:hypothetical protein
VSGGGVGAPVDRTILQPARGWMCAVSTGRLSRIQETVRRAPVPWRSGGDAAPML